MTAAAAATMPAAPARPGEYAVARPGGVCGVCGQPLPPGTRVAAGLRETPVGFERVDAHVDCWPSVDTAALLAFWRTTVPTTEAKRKVFVDDGVLCELFVKLADAAEPAKLHFRFVLGLILMRKRLVTYESSRPGDDGRDVWTVRLRGRDERLELVDPHLTAEQVADVSNQLGEVLNEST